MEHWQIVLINNSLCTDSVYCLLPAVHRYLDLFEELAQAERFDVTPAGDLAIKE